MMTLSKFQRRRSPIASTIQPDFIAPRTGRTATTVSINQLNIEVALLAKALAEVTNQRPLTTWEDETPRDPTLPPPKIEDVVSWLPPTARLLFGRQNVGACQVLATFGQAFAQVSAYMDNVEIVIATNDPSEARNLGSAILEKVPAPRAVSDNVSVGVWSDGNDGPTGMQTVVSVPRWAEIERNYPEGTRQELAELMKFSPDGGQSGRLVLFHGPPGTGKTHAIRALLSEWRDWCDPELVVDPENALRDYRYLEKLLALKRPRIRQIAKRWRLVVAEDADRFIRADQGAAGNEALDRLLNATDGILAQGSRTLFLLTTNVELRTINSALSRPGRCLSAVSFELFEPGEAREWIGPDATVPQHPLSLAELYEMKSGSKGVSDRRPVGIGQYL